MTNWHTSRILLSKIQLDTFQECITFPDMKNDARNTRNRRNVSMGIGSRNILSIHSSHSCNTRLRTLHKSKLFLIARSVHYWSIAPCSPPIYSTVGRPVVLRYRSIDVDLGKQEMYKAMQHRIYWLQIWIIEFETVHNYCSIDRNSRWTTNVQHQPLVSANLLLEVATLYISG